LILDGSRAFRSHAAFPGARAGQRRPTGNDLQPCRRAARSQVSAPARILSLQRVAWHDHRPDLRAISLCGPAWWSRAALRRWRWPRRVSMAGPFEDLAKRGVAGLDAT